MKPMLLIAALSAGLMGCAAQAQYAPPPPPGYAPGPWNPDQFWAQAPQTPRERIDYLEHRIDTEYARGRISLYDAKQAKTDLRTLRGQIRQMHWMDGGRLAPQDQQFVWNRLNQIAHRIRWDAKH